MHLSPIFLVQPRTLKRGKVFCGNFKKTSTSFLYLLRKEVWTCHFFSLMKFKELLTDPATPISMTIPVWAVGNNDRATTEVVGVDSSDRAITKVVGVDINGRAITKVVGVGNSGQITTKSVAIPTRNRLLRLGIDWLIVMNDPSVIDIDATLAMNSGIADVAVGGNMPSQ